MADLGSMLRVNLNTKPRRGWLLMITYARVFERLVTNQRAWHNLNDVTIFAVRKSFLNCFLNMLCIVYDFFVIMVLQCLQIIFDFWKGMSGFVKRLIDEKLLPRLKKKTVRFRRKISSKRDKHLNFKSLLVVKTSPPNTLWGRVGRYITALKFHVLL